MRIVVDRFGERAAGRKEQEFYLGDRLKHPEGDISMPIISVIIPAYNAGKTILETIESVRQQTVSDFEMIVIDDGSTDDTVRQVNGVCDSRLKSFTYDHRGLGAARNRGIEQARGEFISFIDADDLWTPDKLEMQLASLRRRPQAGIAYSWTAFIDEDGKFLFAKEPLHFEGNVYSELLASCFVASGSNVLIRKSCIDAVGCFNETLKCGEDWEYWLRAARRWPFVVVPKYQILYRISPHSLSSHVETIEQECVAILNRELETCPLETRRLGNQCLANVKEYVAFLYLTRGPGLDYKGKAGRRIREAVLLHPRNLLRRKTQNIVITWLSLYLVPARLGVYVVRCLLKVHGRLTMLARKDLRIETITSRLSRRQSRGTHKYSMRVVQKLKREQPPASW